MTNSVAVRGTPDWQGSFRISDFLVLRALDDSTVCFAVPVAACLAQKGPRTPDFFLEFVSDRNGAGPDQSLYVMLDMGLDWCADMNKARAEAAQHAPGAALTPIAFGSQTRWHLESTGLHETMPFAWEDVQRARIHCRLSAGTGNLLYSSLQTGAVTVLRAAVECEVPAVLPRIDSTVSFCPAKLLASLASLNPSGTSIPFQRMVTFFEQPPPDLVQLQGSAPDPDARNIALAIAGRIHRYFGQPAPCPSITEGPHVILTPPADAQQTTTWDLRTPLLTGTPVFLSFDPFTPVIAGGRDQVTRFTRIPPLPEDQLTQPVTVASGLPPNIQNVAAVELTLRVAQEYSASGSAAFKSVTLAPPADQNPTVELKYKRIGAKPYSARIAVISEESVAELPWFECSGDYLFIGADQLAGTCLTVRATSQLLAQADISVEISGTGAPLSAKLSIGQSAASFLLNGTAETARLVVIACDCTKAAPPLRLELPCISVSLDLTSFRQYGPQNVPVTVTFQDAADSVQFDFLPEGEVDPVVLSFSPSQPSGQFSYFATRLFGNRFRYRSSSPDSDAQVAWSDYQSPDQALTITYKQKEIPDLV